MKKILLLLIITGLLYTSNSLAETQVMNNWLYGGQSTTVNNKAVTVYLGNFDDKITVDAGGTWLTITRDACKRAGDIKICYIDSEFDTIKEQLKVQITGYVYTPGLTIERTITKDDVYIDEETTFTTTITNSGEVRLTGIVFDETFPAGIEILTASGLTKKQNTLIWEGSLNAGSSREFTYTIKAKKTMNMAIIAHASYNDDLGINDIYSTTTQITVEPFLEVSTQVNPTSVYAGQEINLTVNLTNFDGDETIINSLTILIPKGISLVTYPSILKKEGNQTLTWDGTISKNSSAYSSQAMKISLQAERKGTANIQVFVDYQNEDTKYSETYQKAVTINEYDLVIRSNLEQTETIEVNQEKRLIISISNQNPYASYKNLRINTTSDLTFFPPLTIETLNKSNVARAIDRVIKGPEVNYSTSYTTTILVDYENEFGDTFSKEYKQYFTILPKDIIELTQTASDNDVEEGDEVTVSAIVNNKRKVQVNDLKVTDALTPLINVTGVTSKNVSVLPGDTLTVYQYTFRAPRTNEKKVIVITTTAYYNDNQNVTYLYKREQSITVNPKQISLGIVRSFSNTNPSVGELFTLSHTVTNSDDETAYNITLFIPKSYAYDTMDGQTAYIERLKPGETATIEAATLRAKINSTNKVENSRLEYYDEDNHNFSKVTSTTDLTIQNGYLDSSAILINKTNALPPYSNEKSTIILNIINIGDEETTVKINDENREWNLSISPKKKEEITYKITMPQEGVYILPGAVVTYPCKGRTCIASSKSLTLNVQNKTESTSENNNSVVNVIEPEIQTKPSELNSNKTPGGTEEVIKKPTFFEKIIAYIEKVFNMD